MKPSQIAYVYLLSSSWGSPQLVTSQVLEREYNIPPQREAPQKVHASPTNLSDKSITKARWQHSRILQSEDNEASTIVSMSMPMFTLTKSEIYRFEAPTDNVETTFSMSMQMEETLSVEDGEVDTTFVMKMQVDEIVDDDGEIDPTDEWSKNEVAFVDTTATSIASTTDATTDATIDATTDATTGATIDATIDATTDVTTTTTSIASPIARPSTRPTKVTIEDIESATTDQLIQNMFDADGGATTGSKPGRNDDGRMPSHTPGQDGVRPANEVGRNTGSKGAKGAKKSKAR